MASVASLPSCTLLRSSTSQSAIPILHTLLAKKRDSVYISCVYPDIFKQNAEVAVYDFSGRVYESYTDEIIAIVKERAGLVDVIVDSVDTLFSDIGSVSSTYKLLKTLLSFSTRLILHCNTSLVPATLLNALLHPSFSSSLTQIIAHNPRSLQHIATEYLVPPDTDSPKWWSIFLPLSTRAYEVEKLVFGSSGDGAGCSTDFVVERVIRDKRKGVQRTLEGWDVSKSSYVDLKDLESLKSIWGKSETTTMAAATAVDPTQNLSFNLNLTESQMQSRALVPLPYAHEGNPVTQEATAAGTIYYDPDSADDIDDDDPDEDLDL